MGLPPLAEVSDLANRLPASYAIEDVRAATLLADASAVVRSFTRRTFTLGQTTERIRPVGYRIKLPQRPVVSVDNVVMILDRWSMTLAGWTWDGLDEVWLVSDGQVINLAEWALEWLRYHTPVCEITYTHGYDQVPADVVGVVCSMVARSLTAPGLGGVVGETVGEYTYRLSDAAAQGTLTLTGAEQAILKPYRRSAQATELRW